MAEADVETVEMKLERYIRHARDLQQRCDEKSSIKGMSKLIRKVGAEIKFLETLRKKSSKNKENSLSSSNLINIEGIVAAIETFPNVTHVLHPFHCPGYEHPLVVDVICNNGYSWVKVIARKAQALHLIWAGEGQYGEKSISIQAQQFLKCAGLHPINFNVPQIVFSFCQGVTSEMRAHLLELGLHVKGELEELDPATAQKLKDIAALSDSSDEESDESMTGDSDENDALASAHNATSQAQQQQPDSAGDSLAVDFVSCPDIKKVNLDVTTLIVLVSNVCHGHCNYHFEEEILNQQAASERQKPVLPLIQEFLEGKELYACQTALSSFKKIVSIVGGDMERKRAEEILSRVTPVDDEISNRTTELHTSAQLKQRAKLIFGTGDSLKAVTTTSNMGFVRAAQNQGVDFSVFLHESRALTEQKQATATPL